MMVTDIVFFFFFYSDDKVGFVLGAIGFLSSMVTMAIMIKLHNRKQER